jgi:acyl-CoA reductase-like NAD-dependent aldehyde dehydrogenase
VATTAAGHALYLDGEWVETGEWLEVRSPYNGEVVGRVAKAGAAEARRAVDAASRVLAEHASWIRSPPGSSSAVTKRRG